MGGYTFTLVTFMGIYLFVSVICIHVIWQLVYTNKNKYTHSGENMFYTTHFLPLTEGLARALNRIARFHYIAYLLT